VTDQERLRLATVELLGALTYGQLRAFEVTATAIRTAPDARTADRLGGLAVREHAAYTVLRDHLMDRTDLAEAVIDRQKPVLDSFFDAAPLDTWMAACAFFAVGLPIAADFTRQVAPTLEPDTATVVVAALTDREPFERFALEQLEATMVDDDSRDEVRHLVADVLGRALTGFQGAMGDTDALQVLLTLSADETQAADPDAAGEALVRRVAITVLEGHRRRMHALGLEDLT
jgi:hypothetical protein